jgi:hypothetical protein
MPSLHIDTEQGCIRDAEGRIYLFLSHLFLIVQRTDHPVSLPKVGLRIRDARTELRTANRAFTLEAM